MVLYWQLLNNQQPICNNYNSRKEMKKIVQFEKIEKLNVTNEVYKQIMDKIINGDWEPGLKIPSENDLSRLFGVSRHSIRSVLNKLNALGLLETKHGEGTFVKKLDPSLYLNSLVPVVFFGNHEYITMMEFRKGIEIESARLAAKNASEEDIKELEELMDALEKSKDDIDQYAEYDINFHVALSKASKNMMFFQTMNILKALLASKFQACISTYGNAQSFEFHANILKAIKNHDPDAASNYMREHLKWLIDQLKD